MKWAVSNEMQPGGVKKKTPTEARISDGGGKESWVGEAGHNSHPIDMIYNGRDKLIQEKKKKPPLTSPVEANGGTW